MSRIKDNNRNIPIASIYGEDYVEIVVNDLGGIANIDIRELLEQNSELLVFPHSFNSGYVSSDRNSIFDLSSDNNISTHNIMGFVGRNNTQLTIASRFETGFEVYFLHYMLQRVFSINIFDFDIKGGNENVWDFLMYLFPYYLKLAITQGLYKEYIRNEYNDPNVKGTIDISRHIRMNMPFSGKVSYSTREYSFNNHITQLIRHTIDYIRTHKWGRNVLLHDSAMTDAVKLITFATPDYDRKDRIAIIQENLRPVNHPYFTGYRTLQKICLKILRQEGYSYGQDPDKIYGLLFDGAWLWEEFLNKILEAKGFEHPQFPNKVNKQYLFRNNECEIIPDFFMVDNGVSIVADAKYKQIEQRIFVSGSEYDRADLYQVLSYMFRYKAKKGYVFFPIDEERICDKAIFEKHYPLHENSYGGEVILLGLKIPSNSESFWSFSQKMKINEDLFLTLI